MRYSETGQELRPTVAVVMKIAHREEVGYAVMTQVSERGCDSHDGLNLLHQA